MNFSTAHVIRHTEAKLVWAIYDHLVRMYNGALLRSCLARTTTENRLVPRQVGSHLFPVLGENLEKVSQVLQQGLDVDWQLFRVASRHPTKAQCGLHFLGCLLHVCLKLGGELFKYSPHAADPARSRPSNLHGIFYVPRCFCLTVGVLGTCPRLACNCYSKGAWSANLVIEDIDCFELRRGIVVRAVSLVYIHFLSVLVQEIGTFRADNLAIPRHRPHPRQDGRNLQLGGRCRCLQLPGEYFSRVSFWMRQMQRCA
mmetsp:Transcript_33992/g.79515  ORF Transcript_33992/g.79515 Transcript_33992/m.79515 type:complete len:256 (-) Transcript_33992:1681-2448(-)